MRRHSFSFLAIPIHISSHKLLLLAFSLILVSLQEQNYPPCHYHRFFPILPVCSAMRLVVQRVKSASVRTVENNQVVSQIGPGLLALVGLHEHDTEADLQHCCKKLLNCKLWQNDNGAMWRHSVKQKKLSCLLVSQFTLYGTLSKKNQPDYKLSMKAVAAEQLYSKFFEMVRDQYGSSSGGDEADDKVQNGVFGAMMDVSLVNDGPVTIIIESDPQAAATPTVDSSATTVQQGKETSDCQS